MSTGTPGVAIAGNNVAAPRETADLVALLFTDIEGSSLRWLNHRSAMQEAMREHDAILRKSIAAHSGEIFKTGGDAFHAAFRRPSDAVGAAIDAQNALAARDFSAVGGLRVRMAVHVGTAERRDNDLFGPALNRAARLLALGHGGQVLVTSSAAELIGAERENRHVLRHLGSHPLDDPSQPVEVHQVEIAGLPQNFPPLRTTEARPTNLPRQLTALIGRDTELERLCAMVLQAPIATLTGTGGVGKTRMTLEAGDRLLANFRDGVWLVELAAIADPSLVPGAVAAALGVSSTTERTPLDALLGRLKHQELLLLLDNCEHLIEAVAALVESVLSACPKVRVLASSQEPLGIAGEQVFRLPSLAVPEEDGVSPETAMDAGAVRLFVERAKAVASSFTLDARSTPTVIAICRRLDGIPLAIEMAAARAPMLGVDKLAQKLDERFRVLTGGRRTALPRQQTLRATLDWSFNLLPEAERKVLRRASIFAGGFTLEAASAVIADETTDEFEVIDRLANLVARSLVVADAVESGTRYRLLETTRAYALEALGAADETASLERRHGAYFRELFDVAEQDENRLSDNDWRLAYVPERDNLRAAIDRAFAPGGDPEIGVALVGACLNLRPYLSVVELRQRLAVAQPHVEAGLPAVIVARFWFAYGGAWQDADSFRGIEGFERALEIYRTLGDERAALGPALLLATRYNHMGRLDEAKALLDHVQPVVEGAPARLRGRYHESVAIQASVSGLPALADFDKAIECFRAAGADQRVLLTLTNRADTLWVEQRLDEAIADFRSTLAHFRRPMVTSRSNIGWVLLNLGGALAERGDVDEALAPMREGLAICREDASEWPFMDHAARWVALRDRHDDAARLIGHSDASYRKFNEHRQPNEERAHAWVLVRLADSLDEKRLAALRAEGERLTGEKACRIVLEG